MADLHILSWRDIPAEVIVRLGSTTARRDLSRRFIEAIDRAALREGLHEGEPDYAAQWRHGAPVACGDAIEAEVEAAAARIEQAYDPKMLAELSAAGGHAAGDDHKGPHRA